MEHSLGSSEELLTNVGLYWQLIWNAIFLSIVL